MHVPSALEQPEDGRQRESNLRHAHAGDHEAGRWHYLSFRRASQSFESTQIGPEKRQTPRETQARYLGRIHQAPTQGAIVFPDELGVYRPFPSRWLCPFAPLPI